MASLNDEMSNILNHRLVLAAHLSTQRRLLVSLQAASIMFHHLAQRFLSLKLQQSIHTMGILKVYEMVSLTLQTEQPLFKTYILKNLIC